MSKKSQLLNAAALILGVAFLIVVINKLGWEKILSYLRNAGWGFFWLVLIHFGVTLGDTLSLWVAIGKKISPVKVAFIGLAGAAINALTPMGEAGEAVKGNLLAPHVSVKRAVSSLIVWNFVYRITKYVIVFAGPFIVYLFEPGLFSLKTVALMFVAALVCFLPTALYALALWKGAGELIVKILSRLPLLNRKDWNKALKAAQETDKQIGEFVQHRLTDTIVMSILLFGARLLVAVEIMTALHLIGYEISYATALFLFTGGTVAATFLSISPVQLGVREAGVAVIYHLIGLPASAGFTQAFLRRLRQLLYNFVGLTYLAYATVRQNKPKQVIKHTSNQLETNHEKPVSEVSASSGVATTRSVQSK